MSAKQTGSDAAKCSSAPPPPEGSPPAPSPARWAACLLTAVLILAAPAAAGAGLAAADKAEVARVEAYLNKITTFKGRFLQASSSGEYSEGSIYVSRPGKIRIEYDKPSADLIVADGASMIHYDKELDQLSYITLGSSPATVLIEDNISLTKGAITVTGIERGRGTLRLTVVKTDDPAEGNLTLVFNARPLGLKKWVVIDAQGVETTVSLLGVQFGLPLADCPSHLSRLRQKPWKFASTPDTLSAGIKSSKSPRLLPRTLRRPRGASHRTPCPPPAGSRPEAENVPAIASDVRWDFPGHPVLPMT